MATYPIRQLADNGGTAQFVPVTAPEAVQFPDGSNLNTFIGSVATIESNPVAANHAVGEFLCINGQVYEVIDAITAGDSISLGENVQVTNLGSQITALNNGLTSVVKKVTLSGTTDSSGNIGGGSTSSRIMLSAVPNRTVNAEISSALITTTAARTAYMVHCIKSDGSVLANANVSIVCVYVDGSLF